MQTEYNNPIGKSIQLEMWVIEIPFKLDNGVNKVDDFNLEVSFQVKNFAVETSHLIFEVIGRKKFVILWYFGFVTGTSSIHKRIAKIEIEHPGRGQLEIQPEEERIEVNTKIFYAKHGRKFICGLHNANDDDKSSMHCFFKYSYMPEWAVILLSVIAYHFFVVFFHIITSTYPCPPLLINKVCTDIFLFIVVTFVVGFFLIKYLRKNCT